MTRTDKSLAIFGTGGHSHVVADCARLMKQWTLWENYDDALEPGRRFCDLLTCDPDSVDVVVAIGDNTVRLGFVSELVDRGFNLPVIQHPQAIVAQESRIGCGSVLMAGAIVNPAAELGVGCIVNTASSIDHHCILADAVHICPGARLAGGVSVGARSWIGIGSVVRETIEIGKDVVVGAGAAVVSNIADGRTVMGVPAR